MIIRDLKKASGREFDLVVIGGGIYGVSVLREAARCGLSACLCEAADFGGETSWNSLRIVHGGLRYLQTLDLRRFFQSVAARRRIALQFPTLVRPLRCLMPLYGQGLKRASVMRMALRANDLLSAHCNDGLQHEIWLPPGELLDAAATRREFPLVRTEGLEGAACWSDYFMISSERILIELLHDACRYGALALNYAPVLDVVSDGAAVRGVRVQDAPTGGHFTIAGRAVVNCAGPRVRELARGQGGEAERLFRPSLAFNLLLDIYLPGDCAMAVAAPQPGAPVRFLVPQSGSVLAGTEHLSRPVETTEAQPTEVEINDFLASLNQAIPGLGARPSHVRRIFSGLLPASKPGGVDLQKRETLEDHGRNGGLSGFYSVSGVKFTTASEVAARVLSLINPDLHAVDLVAELPVSPATAALTDSRCLETRDMSAVNETLLRVVREEAVLYREDLVLRRTSWGATALELAGLLDSVAQRIALPAANGIR